MWPWGHRLGLNARDFNLGGHEVSRVLHLEVGLGVGAVHGRGLLYAEVGLQGEAYKNKTSSVNSPNPSHFRKKLHGAFTPKLTLWQNLAELCSDCAAQVGWG